MLDPRWVVPSLAIVVAGAVLLVDLLTDHALNHASVGVVAAFVAVTVAWGGRR